MKQCWSKNEIGDYVCQLGRLDRAIVICRTALAPKKYYWRISKRSFLPFTKDEYDREFTDPETCATFAEGIVLEWLQSLVVAQKTVSRENENPKTITEK